MFRTQHMKGAAIVLSLVLGICGLAGPAQSAPTVRSFPGMQLNSHHKIHILPVHGSRHAHTAGLITLTQCNTPDCPPAGYASMTYQGGPIVTCLLYTSDAADE